MKNFNGKTLTCLSLILIGLGLIGIRLMPARYSSGFNVNEFRNLPVQEGGRIKPLDTVARNKLMLLSGKQTVRLPSNAESPDKSKKLNAVIWLMDVVMRPEVANTYKVFRIDNAEVLGLFGWNKKPRKNIFHLTI